MEVGYDVSGNIERPDGSGGPCKIASRICANHFELAPIGVFFERDGSVMRQEIDEYWMRGYKCNELRLTWLTREVGAVTLPPVIAKFPKYPPQNITNYDAAAKQALEKANKEASDRFYASMKEACANYGINYHYHYHYHIETGQTPEILKVGNPQWLTSNSPKSHRS